MKFEIYTDGSCKGNGKENANGGWSFIVVGDSELHQKYRGGEKNTTNNRMEMTAIIRACEYFNMFIKDYLTKSPCVIYTDSAYIFNCIVQKWWINWEQNNWINSKKQPVKNRDLWEKLIPFFKDDNFIFRKIAGHAGHEWNEEADRLAKLGAEQIYESNSN